MTLKEIEEQALHLPEDERAKLAHDLIASLDEPVGEDSVEQAWNEEIAKRVKEIQSGKAKGRPAEEVLSEIRARYS